MSLKLINVYIYTYFLSLSLSHLFILPLHISARHKRPIQIKILPLYSGVILNSDQRFSTKIKISMIRLKIENRAKSLS